MYDSSESKIVVGHFYDSPRFVIKCRTSDVLPFGGLWYPKSDDAVSCAKFFTRSHDGLIRVYDDAVSAGLQKVSAQLEASKPAPQVANNP